MSRFHGGYPGDKGRNKGVLAAVRAEKHAEAERRNGLHAEGKPCDSPACPYRPGGPKEHAVVVIRLKQRLAVAALDEHPAKAAGEAAVQAAEEPAAPARRARPRKKKRRQEQPGGQ